jgi:hypothetical protein
LMMLKVFADLQGKGIVIFHYFKMYLFYLKVYTFKFDLKFCKIHF